MISGVNSDHIGCKEMVLPVNCVGDIHSGDMVEVVAAYSLDYLSVKRYCCVIVARGDDEEYLFKFSEGSDSSPTVDIVEAVAWVKGVDATDLDPISRYLDADVLEDFYSSEYSGDDFLRGSNDTDSGRICVEFTYEDCLVTILGGDEFRVEPDD